MLIQMIWTVIYLLSFSSSTHIFYISLEQQKLKKLDSVMLNKVIVEYNIYECAFPNVEISLRIFLTLMVPNCKTERPFSQMKVLKIQTERWDKRGWNPYLCSWLKQICCTKLTLRIKSKIANKKCRRKLFKE